LLKYTFACLIISSCYLQANTDFCEEYKQLRSSFKKLHYKPIEESQEQSGLLFDQLLESLDPEKILFTKGDIDQFQGYRKSLFSDSACDFINQLTTIYHTRSQESIAIGQQLLSSKFHFDSKKDLSYPEFAKKTDDLTENWNTYLHREIFFSLLEYQHTYDTSYSWSQEEALSYVDKAVTGLKKTIGCKEEGLSRNELNKKVYSAFFNAYAGLYDPHSKYFSLSQKDDFLESLSPTELSFGLQLTQNDKGEALVASLVPGGPAWSSNQIHEGDQLIDLQKNGKDLEIDCLDAEQLNAVITASDIHSGVFVFRTKAGKVVEVELQKEPLDNEENVLHSYLLEGKSKVGYIALPDFYSDWLEDNKGCSDAVAKELLKLNKQNIEGFILDLRYNGGGSTEEAVKLAGLFIDWGPITVLKYRDQKPFVAKDMSRGAIFNKPLIILVNGYTASASELTAAALRDYNRAIIVGSRTHGKGTFQQLEILNNGDSYLKVTEGKFYRINNSSHQKKGIEPDIVIPEEFSAYLEYESDLERALENDSVEKKIYARPLPERDIKKVREESYKRQKANAGLQQLIFLNDSLEGTRAKIIKQDAHNFTSLQPLYLQSFILMRQIEELVAQTSSKSYTVTSNRFDTDLLRMSEYKRLQNERILERLSRDLVLNETYLIMNDLISKNSEQ